MPYMRFLFVGPRVCLRLPSDSTSRWTPLPSANSSHCKACNGLSPSSLRTCRAHPKRSLSQSERLLTASWSITLSDPSLCTVNFPANRKSYCGPLIRSVGVSSKEEVIRSINWYWKKYSCFVIKVSMFFCRFVHNNYFCLYLLISSYEEEMSET